MYSFESAPRCGAKTKNNHGNPCRCPAMKGKSRCRVHGGAMRSGAPMHNHNALKDGLFTNEAKAFRIRVRQTIYNSHAIISELE